MGEPFIHLASVKKVYRTRGESGRKVLAEYESAVSPCLAPGSHASDVLAAHPRGGARLHRAVR